MPRLQDMKEDEELDSDMVAMIAHAITFEGYTFKDFAKITDAQMEAVYGKAYQLVDSGRYEDAEKLLGWLAGIDHYDARYMIGIGVCRQMLKRYEGAINAYAAAGLLDIENPVPAVRAAECYLAVGKLEAADSGITAALHFASDLPQYAAVRERAQVLREALDRKESSNG